MCPPLLSLTNLLLLPLSFCYNSITYFLNINTNIETGLVAKNFCIAVKKILREYVLFVNQLDSQNRYENPPLNLQNIWWLCQPCLKLLENLHKLCLKCINVKGGALINIVYSFYLHETDNQLKKMYKFLLEKSFVPFFNMLKLWVCYGFFENEHEFQEFMICSSKDYSKDKINEYYLDLFWEMKFKLNELNVPEFLNRIANKILFIGKSLNIIRETGKIIQCPFEKEFESFSTKDEGNKNISIKKNLLNNNNVNNNNNIISNGYNNNINNNINNYDNLDNNENKQMIFENERLIQFEKLINKIYDWTNDSLRHILFKEKNLDSLLKSFKKFYLMEAGDFYTELIESAKDLFFLEKKNINFEKLKILIDNSIRMTSINSDINKDHFNFFLSNMAISMEKQYLDKYSEILQSNETDIKKITEKIYEIDNTQSGIDLDDMKVYETLNLECKIDWPLNLIFSKKNIIKYKILFRHLLRMKFLEKELNDVWLITQYFKDDKLQSYLKECNFLRDNMTNFVKNIIYYLFNEVIEPNYILLQKNLENSSSMEDVMKYHDQFLNNCINQCLLGNENILIQLSNMIQCISYFSKLTSKYFQNILIKEKEIHQENIGIRYMKITNEFDRKRLKKKERIEAVESVLIQGQDKFKGMFDKFKEGFEKRFKNFLNEINKINISYNPHLTNLLTKLDFNNYYCDRFNKLI
jgi:gamma-tubulin complex component 2